MKKTYKITLPKGAKVNHTITQSANGILEVTVDMEQKYVPKDGDVIKTKLPSVNIDGTVCHGKELIAIFKRFSPVNKNWMDVHIFLTEENKAVTLLNDTDEIHFMYDKIASATEAEKQRLFDALAKQGKRWNAEKKQIEDLPRWRAKKRRAYYYIIQDRMVAYKEEAHEALDNHNYELGNYFRTREAAEKVASQIRDIFKNSKAE